MAHLPLQEEQPMEIPEKYYEEVYRRKFARGQSHCSRGTEACPSLPLARSQLHVRLLREERTEDVQRSLRVREG